jgi:RNA polymerase sigma factor (sigma-70 family)
MSAAEDRWQHWIAALRGGDSLVIGEFCNRYGKPLRQLAERRLATDLNARLDAEDVVQSACRTFLRRVQLGQFLLEDPEGLWRLLCTIALTKIREQARFHGRLRRQPRREVPLTELHEDSTAGAFEPLDPDPTPEEAAAFADEFQQLMASLDPEEQRLVDLKLQEYTNLEAAAAMGCSERTVRRLLHRIKVRLERVLQASDA